MDVVYILGNESPWDNNELRYSLRSVEKYLKGYNNIFIVGSAPLFIFPSIEDDSTCCLSFTGGPVIHWIKHEDNMNLTKERRIMEKVKFACEQEVISDNFLFMNDDMFFLNPINANEFPNYYKGTLLNSARKRSEDRYKRALMNAHNHLTKAGHTALNFDTHAPIIYNKKNFLEVMNCVNWETLTAKRDGYVVKSLYANSLKLEGVFQPDCKIDQPMMPKLIRDKIVDRDFFSVGDHGLTDEMKKILDELYPEPSIWEI